MRKDFALTPEQRSDARRAILILEGSGLSLEDAAHRALSGNRAHERITVSEAIERFLRSRLKAKVRPRTYEWYEARLKPLNEQFGSEMIDDVQRPALFAWHSALNGAESSKAAIARAARVLFAWALEQEPQLVTRDPTIGLSTTPAGNGGEATFLKPEQVAKIMNGAGRYQSALALMFFAGVRPEELAGKGKRPLTWECVRASEKLIRIPGELAKAGKPRVIEHLPEAIWRWLEPGEAHQPICPARSREAVDAAKEALGLPWPRDVSRHTFGTYALALTSNPGQVATWMGHEGNPTMLHRHYRALATRAQAEEFWGIKPRI